MKIETSLTLNGNVAIKLSADLEGQAIADYAADGLGSRAYRGAASKAFKGLTKEAKAKLSYDATVALLSPVFKAEKWTAVFTPHISDAVLKEREDMGKVYDAAVAAKKLPALAKRYDLDIKLDKAAFVLALIEARSTELADLLK